MKELFSHRWIVTLAVLLAAASFVLVWFRSESTKKTPLGAPAAEHCRGSDTELLSCWNDVLASLLRRNGLGASFDMIVTLSNVNPLFARNCHDFSHKLGAAAYTLFSQQEKLEFDLTGKTMYCSFGFYHGFMETLMAKTGDFIKAPAFCTYVDRELSRKSPNAILACYHGIGHGFAESQGDHAWRDEDTIIKRSLAQCETITTDDHLLYLCATGIFDSVAIAYYNNLYGLAMKKEDPLRICYAQPTNYKEPCYKEMMTAILWLGDHTLAGSAPYVEQFAEEEYAPRSIQALADSSIRGVLARHEDYTKNLSVCRSLRPNLRLPCVRGLAEGFLQFGPPGNEYEGALQFCNASPLEREERDICFQGALFYAAQKYPRETVQEICNMVVHEYKKYCKETEDTI